METGNENRWEQLLREKMQGYREKAPADTWARIHATLSGMAGMPLQAARSGGLKRALHRRAWIGYAAAAALLAWGIFFLTRMEEEPLPVPAVAAVDAADGEISPVPGESFVAQEAPARVRREQHNPDPLISRETSPEENRTDLRETAAIPEHAESPNDVEKPPSHAYSDVAENPENNANVRQNNPSTDGALSEWYRILLQEERNRDRRKSERKMSASLYAANMPGSSSTTMIESSTSTAYLFEETKGIRSNTIMATNQAVVSETEIKWKHRTPVTFGATVSFRFTPQMAVETGVLYTRLISESETRAFSADIRGVKQRLDYLGVPLSLTCRFLDSRYVTLYGRVGGTAEYCISAQQVSRVESGEVASNGDTETFNVAGLQTSLGAGAGAMFNIVPSLGFYVEPGASYYFENLNQPTSYRTEHPFNFNLRVGVRVNFR